MTAAERTRRRGRPRDASIDARVLDATRSLLVEVGFSATTIQAISGRSGVPASGIYRRWPSRVQLIEAAVVPAPPDLGPPSGDLTHDLVRFEAQLRLALGSPLVRAALPALLAAYQEGEASRPDDSWLGASWRPLLYAMLDAAGTERVDASVHPDDVFDLILGLVLVQNFVP